MLTLLHSFYPTSVLLKFGPLTIHWYGLCLVLAIGAAILISIKLGKYYNISRETMLDLAIYLIIGGILGARIYEIFLEFPYYSHNLLAVIKIWEGGLAIHGAIIGGIIAAIYFAKKNKLSLIYLIALVVPGMAIGQAIGRWGNWFNQELFGLPSNLPWSIPIETINRPFQYIDSVYFHPTFLYESLGSLLIFLFLFLLTYLWRKNLKLKQAKIIIFVYLFSYSILRFSLEFIKVDQTPIFLGLRWPQVASLITIIISFIILLSIFKNKVKSKTI
ncbi:MAG: prolipoprotein diacylglyceryl transferase [Patescibacteria group bacterium]|nr:prolipoprotein diacylglyceryl transferase [Patescibacteria group bacterium]